MAAVEADTGSRLLQAVRERRSIRAFLPDPVPVELIAHILTAAQWAPSPHNSQPWRFTVLTDRADRERLARGMAGALARELRANGVAEDEIDRQTERSTRRVESAPIAIVCSLHADGLVSYPDARRRGLERSMAVQSVGAVLQTFFLLAWEHGIGTCWMAAPMYCPDEVRSCLALSSDLEPQALILAGYPAVSGRVRPRRAMGEVVDLR